MSSSPTASLLAWFHRTRRVLPWRTPFPRDPYRVLVSESMLQQTQVERVRPVYSAFLERFPTLEALAGARAEEVLHAYSGLGYYRRANLLHATAVAIAGSGGWPTTRATLAALPGLGAYTSAAVAAFSFGGGDPPVDGNVARVAARRAALRLRLGSSELLRAAEEMARSLQAGAANPEVWEALIELGATVCTPAAPACAACPWSAGCAGYATGHPESFPLPRRTRATEEQVWAALWAVRDDRRLLLQRVPGGTLLAGLWLPPFAVVPGRRQAPEAARELARTAGVAGPLEAVPSVLHSITHRRITVLPFVAPICGSAAGEAREGWGWYDPAAPTVPTSSLLAKLRAACAELGPAPARRRSEGARVPRPPTPALTVDAVIVDARRGVVLIRRRYEPHAGAWALPGGFVEIGEECEHACRREAREETGLEVETVALLGVYSRPGRDPRGHTVSAVYLCRVTGGVLAGADDASEARWFAELAGVALAFDHAEVLADACLMRAAPRPA